MQPGLGVRGLLVTCSPLLGQSWPGSPPGPRPLTARRLPSIFCPPHLSANHEEKSPPSLCVSYCYDRWPPSDPLPQRHPPSPPNSPRPTFEGWNATESAMGEHFQRSFSTHSPCLVFVEGRHYPSLLCRLRQCMWPLCIITPSHFSPQKPHKVCLQLLLHVFFPSSLQGT